MLFCWMSVLAYGKCLSCLGWSRLRFSGGGAGIKGKVFYASPMAVAFRNAIGPHVASGLICEATGNAVHIVAGHIVNTQSVVLHLC